MKIGIFDSGLGGLIVTQAIHKLMPEYDYVYLGDTKRVPYGNKSQNTVYEFTHEAVDYLFREENCAIVIIACNTVSARALREIQQNYLPKNFDDRKVLGVLIPSAEVASSYERVGILATSSTVASEAFPIEIKKLNNRAKVFQVPAPMLVPIIEEGDNTLAMPFIVKYLKPLMDKNIDSLVLGCTHYPILKKEIKKIVGENVKIISQDEIIPKKLEEYLEEHKEISDKLSRNRSMKILVTDKTQNMDRLVKRWLNELDQKTNKNNSTKFNVILDLVNDLSPKSYETADATNLKTEMLEIVKNLKKQGKERLAECVENNWNKTAIAYSKELNSWKPERLMEKELIWAFEKELTRLETPDSQKIKILDSIQKQRVIQTAPHLVATQGPRMFCIDWLTSLGIKKEDFYVVAMFSGIPFSNGFRPGRINRKNSSVNLFGSNMQDDLVYQSIIQEKLIESLKDLPAQIKKFFPAATVGKSYTKWALLTCQNIERKILGKDNLIFLDINEVVSNYLIQALKNKEHVFYKILFDSKTREKFMEIFPNELIFYCSIADGKYKKMENMIFSENSLKSKNKEISLIDPRILIKELEENRLCPALIISFLALAFLNEFKCFGSFAQVEYLPVYQEKFSKLSFMKKFKIENVPTSNLTTGVFPSDTEIFAVDLIIHEKELKQKENLLFGELLLKMKDTLIGSYFTGDQRKNGNK